MYKKNRHCFTKTNKVYLQLKMSKISFLLILILSISDHTYAQNVQDADSVRRDSINLNKKIVPESDRKEQVVLYTGDDLVEDSFKGSWPMFRNNPQRTGVAESECLATQILGKNDQRLQTLRKFRDTMLAKNFIGKKLTSMYYTYDDRVLALCRKHPIAETATRKLIGAMILFTSLVVQ